MLEDEIASLRLEIENLKTRLSLAEALIDKSITTLAITNSATSAVWRMIVQHYSPKNPNDAQAAYMNSRGIISSMEGSISQLRAFIESSTND